MADVSNSELLRWLYGHLSLDDPNCGDVAPEEQPPAPKPLGFDKEKDTIKDYPVAETSTSSALFKEEIVEEVNPVLLKELEEMGFAKDRAVMGLFKSGNVTVQAAVDWLFEYKNDAHIYEMPKKDTVKDYPVAETSTSSALFKEGVDLPKK